MGHTESIVFDGYDRTVLTSQEFPSSKGAVDARIDEKAFEPPHSGGRESFDLTLVIVNHSAPRRPVDAAFAARSFPLSFKRSDGSCRRKAVQRHIDQQCVTAGRRRARCGLETLPLRPARIVDVNMGIDQPRQNRRIAEVVDSVTVSRYSIR